MMRLIAFAGLSVVAIGLSAASAHAQKVTDRAEATCPPGDDRDGDASDQTQWKEVPDQRMLSHFIGISECWAADVTNGKQKYLNNLYTSVSVSSIKTIEQKYIDNPGFSRDYKSERRNWLQRVFAGKTTSLLISAKIHIRDPDVDFTVPLLSIDYNGKNGEGESFVTNLTRSDMSQPFFRLTPNSNISVTIDARSSVNMDINAGGVVVGALKDALALAAPGSSLVTTVNSGQLNKIASTFDSGLSKLWSNSITESSTSGKIISEWYPKAAIFVSVDLPDDVRTYDDRQPNADDGVTHGYGGKYARRTLWFKIQLGCPRLSIFDTTNICEFTGKNGTTMPILANSPYLSSENETIKIENIGKYPSDVSKYGAPGHGSILYKKYISDLEGRIDSHQVLNYNLAAGKTIRQFITSQEWYANLVKTFTVSQNPGKSVSTSKIGEFCETVVEQLYNAGLSDLDSRIALWALVDGLPDFVNYKAKFSDATCAAHMPWSPSKDSVDMASGLPPKGHAGTAVVHGKHVARPAVVS